MSTKTTFKRVALVAVASLGFGVLSSVAPASAAEAAGLTTAINGVALTTNTNVINTTVSLAVGQTTAAGAAATITAPTVTLSAKVTSYPVGGAANITAAEATAVATAGDANLAGTMTFVQTAPYASCVQTGANDAVTDVGTTTGTAAGAGFCKLTFTPTVAGTYIVTVWRDYANVGAINDNEVSQTFSFTAVAAGASTSVQFPNSADTTASTDGTLNGIKVGAVAIETVQVSGRTGIQVGFSPQYRLTRNAGATTANNSGTMVAKYANIAYSVANPAGTAVTVVSAQGGTTASTSQNIAGSSTGIVLADTAKATSQRVDEITGNPQKGSTVWFSAATAGTYTITAFNDANLDTLVSVGEATTTSTVVIVADALPSITMTTYGNSLPADAAAGGNLAHLVKISLKNGTTPASLGLSEVLTISGPTGTLVDFKSERAASLKLAMVAGGGGESVALTQANFNALGDAYINVGVNVKGTHVLSAIITGGTAAGAAGSGSITVLDAALYPNTKLPDVALTYTNLTGVAGTGRAADGAAATFELTVKAATATTVSIGGKPGAGITAKAYEADVTDNFGLITGVIGGGYTLYKTVGTTETTATSVISFSVALPAMASTMVADAVKVEINVADTSDNAGAVVVARFDISQAAASAGASYVDPTLALTSHTFRAGVGSSNKLTMKLVDNFGNVLPNISVNAAIAGRNATTVIATMLTDANGQVSYTLVDASVSTVTYSDVVTFSPTGGSTSAVTINYATYLPAATITMTTADSAAATASGIAGATKTPIYSEGSLAGAEGGAVAVSVVLKDANGATLPSGIPVTFSVAGTGVAILSTHVTVYTDAAGKALSYVYGWLNGDRVVTATAGAVTATGTYYFRQDDASSTGVQAEARTIAAKATGNVVTATVTDRFGNPIKGINVVASRAGTGTFNGTSSITGVTDAAGEVQFVLTNGTADVTVGFTSSTFAQSYATKGYADAGVTAILANTAGTTVLAEAGVGASFDAAGVNSVKLLAVADTATLDASTAAGDAAAEATDAANAATDAANAAAEAADAATAAAQDAADAVAALSTQVSEMIDALKKQITALTNLVIKIQKKVKA